MLLGDEGPDGWGIKYAREFDMTNDSKLFPPRPKWEERGYKPDEYGRWIGPDGDVALPLYEGRMVGQFDFSQKGWVSGKGRGAKWHDIPWEKKVVEPQYLVEHEAYLQRANNETRVVFRGLKIGVMAIGSSTNMRSLIAGIADDKPFGNSVISLHLTHHANLKLAFLAVINSLAFDFTFRARLGGINVNQFVLKEAPCLPPTNAVVSSLVPLSARLSLVSKQMAHHSMRHREHFPRDWPWQKAWAVTPFDREAVTAAIEALCWCAFEFSWDDAIHMCQQCDFSEESFAAESVKATLDPKGFWRVDKSLPPELRHTVLSLVAFHDLQAMIASHNNDRDKGITAFCTQNNGEGWMLPSQLRLSDYGLGHDDRAREYQPVAEKFGPRFYDWQLAQSPEESWAECERHARNILGEEGFARLLAEIERAKTGEKTPVVNEPVASYDKKSGLVDGEQMRLL